jgi:uncharacterized coiled-coil protein SlyX
MKMAERSAPDAETFFRITDSHSARLGKLEEKQAVQTHQITHLELSNRDMCNQLIKTEVKVMESQKSLTEKVDSLRDDKLRAEGAARIAKWIPILIQAIVGVTVLIAFFKK